MFTHSHSRCLQATKSFAETGTPDAAGEAAAYRHGKGPPQQSSRSIGWHLWIERLAGRP